MIYVAPLKCKEWGITAKQQQTCYLTEKPAPVENN